MSSLRPARLPPPNPQASDRHELNTTPWSDAQRQTMRTRLLRWYDANLRDLPWRRTRDPYRIWLSEIMLQQTRVAAVVEYYERFLRTFPTIRALACAPLDAVLRLWAGLGYYSRAKNLHAAARKISDTWGGRFPRSIDELMTLPGVGRYTAGAVVSIAFGRRAAAVDGNVKRVLARLAALDVPIENPRVQSRLWTLAETLVPPRRPGDFNQALMELGATVCTPRAPSCGACPVRAYCRARQMKRVDEFPRRGARPAKRRQDAIAIAVHRAGRYLFVRRPDARLLGGFWGLPQIDAASDSIDFRELIGCINRELALQVRMKRDCGSVRHEFTHLSLTLRVYEAALLRERHRASGLHDRTVVRWLTLAEYQSLPISVLDRKIVRLLRARR